MMCVAFQLKKTFVAWRLCFWHGADKPKIMISFINGLDWKPTSKATSASIFMSMAQSSELPLLA